MNTSQGNAGSLHNQLCGSSAPLSCHIPLFSLSPRPKFVAVSSGAGSIGGMDKLLVENTGYGSSKTPLKFIIRKIHLENPHLIAFPVNPGWLWTELGNVGVRGMGHSEALVALQDGVNGVLDRIDTATRERSSGKVPVLGYRGASLVINSQMIL